MVVGHDDAVAAGGQFIDLVQRVFADDFLYAMGQLFRELGFPRVDPAHPTRQARQQWHQGPADMTGAEHGNLRLHLTHGLEQQYGHAATALAQTGT